MLASSMTSSTAPCFQRILILQHQSLCPEVERMIREMRRHENADALCMKTQHKIEKAVCISSFSMRRRLIENEVPNLSVLP